jgi:hypothetical protein
MHRFSTAITTWTVSAIAWLTGRLEPVDERGGGRNTDEGFHISGGAVVAGAIAAGVGAFVAKKLGALD